MSASPKDFTRDKLKKMEVSASPAKNGAAGDKEAASDEWGNKSGKNSSRFNNPTSAGLSEGRASHLGRAGRAMGGRVARANGGATPSGQLHRTLRTDKERKHDIALDVVPGGIMHATDKSRPDMKMKVGVKKLATGGRAGFARGGKTKGKTVVNVVVAPQGGGGGGPGGSPMPPAMPPPMPMPPPQRPPMPPPGMMPPGGAPGGPNINVMPSGGAPMGAAGAPPPGIPPGLRKRGGRVGFSDSPQTSERAPMAKGGGGKKEFGKGGTHDFGKGGTRAQASVKQEAGSGGGLGRLEKAKREART
jgi:hypothetical protein